MGFFWCCCTAGECWTFEDDFNRSDSSDLGSDWNEISGDWEIDTNRLHEPSTSGPDKVACTQPVPLRSAGEMRVTVSIINPVVGDEFYVYLAGEDDHLTAAEWARFTYQSTNTFLVELSTGESQTMSWAPTTPGVFPVVACCDSDGFLMAAIASSTNEYPWSDEAGTLSGRYAGLGHGDTTSGATFDDFTMAELRIPGEICLECFCRCGSINVPKDLTITFQCADLDEEGNPTGRASCLHGLSGGLTWEWNGGTPRWLSDEISVPNSTNKARFTLGCSSADTDNPADNFQLQFAAGYRTCCAGNPGGCTASHTPTDASSCSPLSLVFGPFILSTGELTCDWCHDPGTGPNTGDYYLVVTE